jgi:hypothetical protein
MTKPRTFMLVLCASLAAGCTAFSCDDGLSPAEWDARELQRATARLPHARVALEQEFSRALRTHTPKGPVLDQLTSPVKESFHIGGIFTLGARHSRHGLFGSASMYLVYREHIWVTPQEVLLMICQSSTTSGAFTKVVRLPYDDIAQLGARTSRDVSSLGIASRQANTSYGVSFALGDSIRVARLVRLVLERAPAADGPILPPVAH